PGDYVLAEVYLPYFAGRDVLTLGHALKHHGPGAGRSVQQGLAWIGAQCRERWQRGANVYALEDMLGGHHAFASLVGYYGMTPAASRAFLLGFAPRATFTIRGLPVYRLSPPLP